MYVEMGGSTDGGIPPAYTFTMTQPQHEILGEIIADPSIEPGHRPMANLNFGVAADDDSVGFGYIMHSAENVHTRFRSIDPNNADHFVAVRYHENQWQYTNDDELGWLDFTPQVGDFLVAEAGKETLIYHN